MTSLIIAFSISLVISILIGRSWIKSTKNKEFSLSAEALRNPINTGITVSGFIIPIIVGLISYLYLNREYKMNSGHYLYSSMILIIVSTLIGLWNNYALATLTKDNGIFPITNKENTTFPAFFVFQLSLLFLGILYLSLFGIKNINPTNHPKQENVITQNNKQQIFVEKQQILINTSKDSLLLWWGIPKMIIKKDSFDIYKYISDNSDYDFYIYDNKISIINVKLKP